MEEVDMRHVGMELVGELQGVLRQMSFPQEREKGGAAKAAAGPNIREGSVNGSETDAHLSTGITGRGAPETNKAGGMMMPMGGLLGLQLPFPLRSSQCVEETFGDMSDDEASDEEGEGGGGSFLAKLAQLHT
jgi:hypothetical protein